VQLHLYLRFYTKRILDINMGVNEWNRAVGNEFPPWLQVTEDLIMTVMRLTENICE
jgi:hypothetical protein